MKWDEKPEVLRKRRAGSDGQPLYLGSYVETDTYGFRGRITKFHDGCPESESWLRLQEDKAVRDLRDEAWVSVLVHEGGRFKGGSVTVPVCRVHRIDPFNFSNPWADEYWEEYA